MSILRSAPIALALVSLLAGSASAAVPEADELLVFSVQRDGNLTEAEGDKARRALDDLVTIVSARKTPYKLARAPARGAGAAPQTDPRSSFSTNQAERLARRTKADEFVFVEVAPLGDDRIEIRGVRADLSAPSTQWRTLRHVATRGEEGSLEREVARLSANLLDVMIDGTPLREVVERSTNPEPRQTELAIEPKAFEQEKKEARARVKSFKQALEEDETPAKDAKPTTPPEADKDAASKGDEATKAP